MATFKYFANCATIEEVKAQFHKLCFKLHPDMGGSAAEFREMRAEYEKAFEAFKRIHKNKDGEQYEKETDETADDMARIIEALIKLRDIKVELIGSWLWVTGETKENKDLLSKLGLRYSPSKKAWYWHEPGYVKRSRRGHSLDEIRESFDNEIISDTRNRKGGDVAVFG